MSSSKKSSVDDKLNKQQKNIKDVLFPLNLTEDNYDGNNLNDEISKGSSKRKFHINCNLQTRLLTLPRNTLFKVISFLMDDYRSLVLVSPLWYYKINECMDDRLIELDNQFIKNHMNILSFQRSFSSFHPFKFGKRMGFRMDRNFVAEPLPNLVGKNF